MVLIDYSQYFGNIPNSRSVLETYFKIVICDNTDFFTSVPQLYNIFLKACKLNLCL